MHLDRIGIPHEPTCWHIWTIRSVDYVKISIPGRIHEREASKCSERKRLPGVMVAEATTGLGSCRRTHTSKMLGRLICIKAPTVWGGPSRVFPSSWYVVLRYACHFFKVGGSCPRIGRLPIIVILPADQIPSRKFLIHNYERIYSTGDGHFLQGAYRSRGVLSLRHVRL